jgi:hypothetical protein
MSTTVTPVRADDASLITDPRRRLLVLAAVCGALVAVVAGVSALNVAQQAIARELGASQNQILWAINGYTVALAALLMPVGAIGDRRGRKPVLLAGPRRTPRPRDRVWSRSRRLDDDRRVSMHGAPRGRPMSDAVVAIGSVVADEVRAATLDVLNDEAQVIFLQDQPPRARAETLRDATVLIVSRVGRDVSPDELAEAKRLRLVQFLSAGVDGIDFTTIPRDVVITDNAGAYAKPMAEHAVAMALALAKRLPQRHAALAAGLQPRDGRTVVREEEAWDGLVARLFRRSLQKTLDRALESGLRHLKAEVERCQRSVGSAR